MEEMIKTREFMTMAAANANPHRLVMHKNSKTICKPKPTIRIIHIIPPEIIKTDVENFRDLVQRLTGKPPKSCRIKKPGTMSTPERDHASLSNKTSRKLELRNGHEGLESRDRIKVEEGIWDVDSSGGYLGGFADFEGFISDMNGEFPLFA